MADYRLWSETMDTNPVLQTPTIEIETVESEGESGLGMEVDSANDNVVAQPEVRAEPDPTPPAEPKIHMNGHANKTVESYPHVDGIACTLSPASDYLSSERNIPVKIRYSGDKNSITGRPAISVMEFFQKRVNKFPNRPALKVERDGQWIQWTYKEYLEEVFTVAKAFIKLGLEPYNSVGILGFNSPEWLFSNVGAIYAGGLSSGIYTTNTAEACQYVCADAQCNIVVVENDLQLQKILQVRDRIPSLKAIVQYTGEVTEKLPNVHTWNELIEMGKAENDVELQRRINAQSPNNCCALIYTSGTTGNPKGVMISHDNLVTSANGAIEQISSLVDPDGPFQEVTLSYLPLSHIAAQMQDIWLPVALSACVAFAKPDALKGSLVHSLHAIRPTLFVGVPRVFEKMEEKLKSVGAQSGAIKRKMGAWAKGVALRGNTNIEAGKPVPYGWTVATTLLKKVRKALGLDRAKYVITAAAPISKQTLQYFQSINIPLMEVYGTSESTGALTLNYPGVSRICSIGQLMNIDEYKVGNPDEDGSGELMYRGRNVFMGYLNNDDKTREALDDDGWLHTGDVGKVDDDGFFYITGRIKELIVTAGGENIAPVPIEDNIKLEIPLVATAMVIGDKKKFLSCLLTCGVVIDLNTGLPTDDLLPSAISYLSELGIEAKKASEIAPNVPEKLRAAIQEGVNKANKNAVSNAARVQKWYLLPNDFTTESGELGPTQKLRRPHVMKMPLYKEIIDGFYVC